MNIFFPTRAQVADGVRRFAAAICSIALMSGGTMRGALATPVDLNLASKDRTILLTSQLLGSDHSVHIRVGNGVQTFSAGQAVTPAEYVAIQQALVAGRQTLLIGTNGSAVGGKFDVGAFNSSAIGRLLIPQKVSALSYTGNAGVSLVGNLINFGALYALQGRSADTTVSIAAQNIINEKSGVIAALSGRQRSSLNLLLKANDDFINLGRVFSSGDLTIETVHGGFTNGSEKASAASIFAGGDFNLIAGNGIINNSATIVAKRDINMSSPQLVDISVNSTGGTVRSLTGNINLRDSAYIGNANTNLLGGNWYSHDLNVYAGGGAITGFVGKVTGNLDTWSSNTHFYADGNLLKLGTNNIEGDPTFVSTGDIQINGPVTAGESITIIAGGNISASGDAYVSTRNSVGASGAPATDVALIAGANVATTGTTTATVPGTNIAAGTTASVDFSAGSGGNIDLTGSTHVGPIIDTGSSLSAGPNNQMNGGNVTLAAFASGATGGKILLPNPGTSPNTSIDTSSTNGSGGNVSIIAGSNGTSAIAIAGDIRTSGATNSGSVLVAAAQPKSSDGNAVVFDSSGANVSGNTIIPAATTSAAVSLANINTAGLGGAANALAVGYQGGAAGAISISAGSIVVGDLNAYGGGGSGGAGGTTGNGFSGGAGGAGGNISLVTTGAASTGGINASGGGGGGGGGAANALATGGIGGSGGQAGSVSVNAGGAVVVAGSILASDGAAGGAGGGNSSGNSASGSGGGGGGASYGGGGGGGGGGAGPNAGVSGGGGGGAYGGGGGSGSNTGNNLGGGGGGGFGAGAGGDNGTGNAGLPGVGSGGGDSGSYSPSPGKGGLYALPGSGGAAGIVSQPTGANGSSLSLLAASNNDIAVSGSSISVSGIVFGRTVSLQTPFFSSGNISLGNTVTGTTSVGLTVNNTGSVSQSAGSIYAPALNIVAGNGTVGSLTANGTSGAINVNVNTGASGTVTLVSSGDLNLVGNQTLGTLNVTSAGSLTVAPNAVFNVSGALNLTSYTAITFGTNSSITDNNGGVNAFSYDQMYVNTGASIVADFVVLNAFRVVNDGFISCGGNIDSVLQVNNNFGDLTLTGSGRWLAPNAFTASAVGNIDLAGLFNGTPFVTKGDAYFDANFLVVAGKNIFVSSGSGDINTSTSDYFGAVPGCRNCAGSVTLIAGAAYTLSGTDIIVSNSGNGTGSITLPGGIIATSAIGPGGPVTLIAYNGTINLPSTSLIDTRGNTGGRGAIYSAPVIAIAGAATAGNSVTLGNIITAGVQNGTGTVTIAGAVPVISGGTPAGTIRYFDAARNSTSGNFTVGALDAGSISVGNINTLGAAVTIQTAQSITVGNVITAGAGGAAATAGAVGQSAGNITLAASNNITSGSLEAFGGGGNGGTASLMGGSGGTGGTISITSLTGNITIGGDINSSGGGGGGGGAGAAGGVGGGAGDITVEVSSGQLQISGPILSVGGGGGGGQSCCTGSPGGGSLGGGGGGGDGGAGGGGLYGGGGSTPTTFGTGGGNFGGGLRGGAGVNGGPGQGGGGFDGTSTTVGGEFGASGFLSSAQSFAGQPGVGDIGGAAGNSGTMTITGSKVSTPANSTVGSFYTGVFGLVPSNGFSSSTYSSQSIAGGTTMVSTTSDVSIGGGVYVPSANVSIIAGGSLNSGTITAAQLLLVAGASIGSALQPVVVDTQYLTANAGGDAFVSSAGASAVHLVDNGSYSNGAGGQLSIAASAIDVDAAVAAGGQALFTTSSLNVAAAGTINAASVEVDSASNSDLTIMNAGSIAATNGDINIVGSVAHNVLIGGGGNMSATNGATNITAVLSADGLSNNYVEFIGNQNIHGSMNVNASGVNQQVAVDNNVTVTGDSQVVLSTPLLNLIGTGAIIGNPLILNSRQFDGTIADSTGSLDLSQLGGGNLIFHGTNLVILSSGDITDGGLPVAIDLSRTFGDGGNLVMLAGFTFAPSGVAGSLPPNTSAAYTINGTVPGKIALGNTTINTSGTNAGGSVTGIAEGSITLGSITTSGVAAASGGVTLIGEGINVLSSIDTSNPIPAQSGAIKISSATPTISVGPIVVQGGGYSGGTFVETPSSFNGDIQLSGVNAGSAAVRIVTGGTGHIGSSASILSGSLFITSGTGGIGSSTSSVMTSAGQITANAPGAAIWLGDNASSLTINGVTRFTTFNLTFSGSGPLNVGATLIGHDISIVAPLAQVNLSATNSIAAVADSVTGNGGSIDLFAADIVWTGMIGSPLALTANGTGIGNGGSISVSTLTSSPTTIGTGPGDFMFSTNSGTSGGNAGNISFTAPNSALLLQTVGSNPVGIQSKHLGANGAGASICLTANSLDWTSSATSSLLINSGAGAIGDGGKASIVITSANPVSIGTAAGQINLIATGGTGGGNGGSVVASTLGSLVIDTAAALFGPLAANGNGGMISLTGNTVVPNLGTTLILFANGQGNGNGGTIQVTSNSTAAMTVGTPLIGNNFEFIALSGKTGGNGGTVSLSVGGPLTVNPAGINVNPLGRNGNGGSISLLAGQVGAGNLLVTSNLSASGRGSGIGGNILLASNSSTAFNVGSKLTTNSNGVRGTLNVYGRSSGTLRITNANGGVTTAVALPYVSSAIISAHGPIILGAGIGSARTATIQLAVVGSGNISATSTAVLLYANSVDLVTAGGSIGGPTSATMLQTLSRNVTLSAPTGFVNVRDKATGIITLNDSTAGTNFSLSSVGSLLLSGHVVAGPSAALSLSSAGSIQMSNSNSDLAAYDVNFTAGAAGLGTASIPLEVRCNFVSAKSVGSAYIDNTNGGAGVLVQAATSRKVFTLISDGSIGITGSVGTTAATVNLISTLGDIVTSGSGIIYGNVVNLSAVSGSVGGLSALKTSAASVGASAATVTIHDILTGSTTILNSNSTGDFIVTTNGSTRVNNITVTNGSIDVVTGGASLTTRAATATAPGSLIIATNGSVTLQNNNLTRGTISLGRGTAISTAGPLGGDVNIVIGQTPISPVSGTPPAGGTVQINNPGSGSVFFGANGISAVAPLNVLTLNGANIIFNTGSLSSSAIKLGGSVSITADPVNAITTSASTTGVGYSSVGNDLFEEVIVDTGFDP